MFFFQDYLCFLFTFFQAAEGVDGVNGKFNDTELFYFRLGTVKDLVGVYLQ